MIHEIHLTRSLLAREQHNTPKRFQRGGDVGEFICLCVFKRLACRALSKWGLSFSPWWGYLSPLYPHASPRLCWLLPTWENGLDDMMPCSSQQIKHNPKNFSKLNKSPLALCPCTFGLNSQSTVMFVDCKTARWHRKWETILEDKLVIFFCRKIHRGNKRALHAV